jgi:hypothetical protein
VGTGYSQRQRDHKAKHCANKHVLAKAGMGTGYSQRQRDQKSSALRE